MTAQNHIQVKAPGNFVMREITDATFERDVKNSKTPVFVFFYSPTCGACASMDDTLNKIGIAFNGRLTFYKMAVHSNPATSGKYATSGMPCSVIFNNGDIVRNTRILDGQSIWVGDAANLQFFLNWLNNVLNIIGENW